MRKLKIILFAVVSTIILGFFGFEVLAAVFVNINVGGRIQYSATQLGAQIFGAVTTGSSGANCLNFRWTKSGENSNTVETEETSKVITITGAEEYAQGITACSDISFTAANDTRTIFIFVKDTGDRAIIPGVNVSVTSAAVSVEKTLYHFDNDNEFDPLANFSQNLNHPRTFIDTVNSKLSTAGEFTSNMSLDPNDFLCVKVVFTNNGSTTVDGNFTIEIALRTDIIYNSNNILSVYQPVGQTSSKWTKYGYNATLSAEATKVEANNFNTLANYLENDNVPYGRDDYQNAVVYKDIDLVNINLLTGEVLGKLSDPNYPFEWYGRPLTLQAGTILASGRVLTQDETFSQVDVYTYYPTMYVRRWIENGKRWLSVSDHNFAGAVKVDEYYLATFEATTFMPEVDGNNDVDGYTASYNSESYFIPRSYVYDRAPFTSGSISYLRDNYGYTIDYGLGDANQETMMVETNLLTTQWNKKQNDFDQQYRGVESAQGQNWKQYVWNMLYLIKYADNNSQEQVGRGNVDSYTAYNQSGVQIKNINHQTIAADNWQFYEAEIGSGAIGLHNANVTANADGYNGAKMAYGYRAEYKNGQDRKGLFVNQFLTKTDADKRYLLDGYVGSNGYTSVFCLGKCNPWGNVWEWIFGTATIYDGEKYNTYIQFNDWDGSNWQFANDGDAASLTNKSYTKLGYNLPTISGYYNYLGVDNTSTEPKLSLIGMQTSTDTAGANGLTDYYYSGKVTTGHTFGVLHSGAVYGNTDAGAFCFYVHAHLAFANVDIGFRPSLSIRQ